MTTMMYYLREVVDCLCCCGCHCAGLLFACCRFVVRQKFQRRDGTLMELDNWIYGRVTAQTRELEL